MSELQLLEVCSAYQAAIHRIAALTPDLVLVVVDDNIDQALEMVGTVSHSQPGVVLVPAGTNHDASMILRSVRCGAREFLPLPAAEHELSETVRRVCPGFGVEAQGGERATGDRRHGRGGRRRLLGAVGKPRRHARQAHAA